MGRLFGIDMPLALAEFLYSAILWGSLISWLLWKIMRRWPNVWSILLLGGPFLWLCLHTVIAWYGFFFPPMGRVLDDSPDRPMAGERVIATWVTYPMGLWTSYCSGRQVHLTDSDGEFTFRFAPWPTLVWGSLQRGVNSRVPGRIGVRTLSFFWDWPHGDRQMRRLHVGSSAIETGPSTQCRVNIAPQHEPDLVPVPTERPSFLRLYEELCVHRYAWAANGTFIRDLRHWQRPLGLGTPFPPELNSSFMKTTGSYNVMAIPSELHDPYCEHFRASYEQVLQAYPVAPGSIP